MNYLETLQRHLDVFGSVFGCLGVSLDVFGSVLGCLWGVFRCLWVIHRFVGQVWEQPGLLCVFQVFSVSRDTQSNLGFSQSNLGFPRTKPLFPDDDKIPGIAGIFLCLSQCGMWFKFLINCVVILVVFIECIYE